MRKLLALALTFALATAAHGQSIINPPGGSGSGSPGGSNTQVQFNNSGSFGGASGITTNGTDLTLGSSSIFGWSTDLKLARDAANTLAQRNGTNAQTFNLYNTYTDASNYERIAASWSSNVAYIVAQNAGTGSARTLILGGSGAVELYTANTRRWRVDTNGHFLAITDNTYDIGASGANRPRSVYVADTVYSNDIRAGTGAAIYWAIGTQLRSSTDGNIFLQNGAQTSFGLLQFGGTTSSFPAIKRSSAALAFRLADDSADAAISFGGSTNSAGEVNHVRNVTAAGAITVTSADYIILVNKTSGAATTVNLNSSPVDGQTYVIKDLKGDAATNNITITPASGNIDNAATYVMNINKQSVNVSYSSAASQWFVW